MRSDIWVQTCEKPSRFGKLTLHFWSTGMPPLCSAWGSPHRGPPFARNREIILLTPKLLEVIFGVSTGTLDDELARAYEQGAPHRATATTDRSSRRSETHFPATTATIRSVTRPSPALRRAGASLVCDSPPRGRQARRAVRGRAADYRDFAENCAKELRTERCEHVSPAGRGNGGLDAGHRCDAHHPWRVRGVSRTKSMFAATSTNGLA